MTPSFSGGGAARARRLPNPAAKVPPNPAVTSRRVIISIPCPLLSRGNRVFSCVVIIGTVFCRCQSQRQRMGRIVMHVDVAVIGGGIAGLTAANRAAQLGLQAAVLEAGAEERYLCNSRFTGGAFHVCMESALAEPAVLERRIGDAIGPFVAPSLARAVAADARRAVDWLAAEGTRTIKAGPRGWQDRVLAPPALPRAGLHWPGRGGDVLLRRLEANLRRRGGTLIRGARADALAMTAGHCTGVTANGPNGRFTLQAGAVVLADGGFQGDADLVRRFISPRPESVRQRGAGTGRGDGLRMAEAIGVALCGMDSFYGHLLCQDALQNDALWPYPWVDELVVAGMAVDRAGARFLDEGRGGVHVANLIARQPDPLLATAIFDQAIWDGPGKAAVVSANPHLVRASGELITAGTVAALAERLSMPALGATVASHNAAVASGQLGSLTPPRSAHAGPPMPIAKAPFYAIRLCAGMTYTMGGIKIDAESRALWPDGQPVAGLFAAGATTGGIEGGPNIAYLGGLTKAAGTALRAAEAIARDRQARSAA